MPYKDSWKQKNVEKHKEMSRKSVARWRERNPDKGNARAVRLPRLYGIFLDQYEELLTKQGGVCAICQRRETRVQCGVLQPLAIDHDHKCCPEKKSCGRCIRGLLCESCNLALGLLGEDPQRIHAVLLYLQKGVGFGH